MESKKLMLRVKPFAVALNDELKTPVRYLHFRIRAHGPAPNLTGCLRGVVFRVWLNVPERRDFDCALFKHRWFVVPQKGTASGTQVCPSVWMVRVIGGIKIYYHIRLTDPDNASNCHEKDHATHCDHSSHFFPPSFNHSIEL